MSSSEKGSIRGGGRTTRVTYCPTVKPRKVKSVAYIYGRSERLGLGRGVKYGLGGMPERPLICDRRSVGLDGGGGSRGDGGCWIGVE